MLHKFEFDGTKIVLDVHSGAVHVVDNLAWKLLDVCRRMDRDEILRKYQGYYDRGHIVQCLEEIEELRRGGLLFSSDPFKDGYVPRGDSVVKALCLHLAHACNLRCRYCFAGQGSFGGPEELMPLDTGRKAIDLLISLSGGRKRLEIDFFGGEPLLNFGVLKELVDYSRRRGGESGKQFSFTVTTNAVLLDGEMTEYLNDHNINVVLSLDGRREVHDAMRPAPGGRGSYDHILPRIKGFVDSRTGSGRFTGDAYTIVRGTYTRHNLDFSADVLHMAGLGFDRLSIEPVVAPDEAGYSIRQEDLPALFTQYEELARALLRLRQTGHAVDFFHFDIDLEGGPCLPMRLSGCGAGHEYLAVAPNGDIYPCHQFVGRSDYLMGSVNERRIDTAIAATFRRAHIYNKEGCVDCWAKYYCSGGCHANAESFNGTIFKPHGQGCELVRKRLECALYLKVKESTLP